MNSNQDRFSGIENRENQPELEEETTAKTNGLDHESLHESLLDRFSKTSTAAKFSGTFNEATGYLKKKLGEISDDSVLRKEGRDQELLGKVHSLVGNFREIRELSRKKIESTRNDLKELARHHTGNFLDGISSFLDDVKKRLF